MFLIMGLRFFFFQAEDGIRDLYVTGAQTCALPICNIGPSLGQDSIDQGIHAAAIAVILVVLIMGIYYRFAGLLAIGGLICYVLMTMGVLAGLEAEIGRASCRERV